MAEVLSFDGGEHGRAQMIRLIMARSSLPDAAHRQRSRFQAGGAGVFERHSTGQRSPARAERPRP